MPGWSDLSLMGIATPVCTLTLKLQDSPLSQLTMREIRPPTQSVAHQSLLSLVGSLRSQAGGRLVDDANPPQGQAAPRHPAFSASHPLSCPSRRVSHLSSLAETEGPRIQRRSWKAYAHDRSSKAAWADPFHARAIVRYVYRRSSRLNAQCCTLCKLYFQGDRERETNVMTDMPGLRSVKTKQMTLTIIAATIL